MDWKFISDSNLQRHLIQNGGVMVSIHLPSLSNLCLVGRILCIPARILQEVSLDDWREIRVVIAHTDIGFHDLILRCHFFEFFEKFVFRVALVVLSQLHRSPSNRSWHRGFHHRLQRRKATCIQHLFLLSRRDAVVTRLESETSDFRRRGFFCLDDHYLSLGLNEATEIARVAGELKMVENASRPVPPPKDEIFKNEVLLNVIAAPRGTGHERVMGAVVVDGVTNEEDIDLRSDETARRLKLIVRFLKQQSATGMVERVLRQDGRFHP